TGYDTATTMLLLNDPDAGLACPAGDHQCWITWTFYMGGSGYNHVAQGPLYNIYWSPVCDSDYFDIPGSDMQQCFDTWTHRGSEPVALTATWSNGDVAYSGSYQTMSGGYYQYTGLTLSQYNSTFNTLAGQGYRPVVVNVNWWNSAWRVEALFRPQEGPFYSY